MACAPISFPADVYNFGNLEQNPDEGLGIPIPFSNVYLYPFGNVSYKNIQVALLNFFVIFWKI
jgi:hypothetical protein